MEKTEKYGKRWNNYKLGKYGKRQNNYWGIIKSNTKKYLPHKC